MSHNLVIKTEIHEFVGEFVWKIHRQTDHWNHMKAVKSPIVEFVDEKSGKILKCHAVINSWKEITVLGDADVSRFRICEINEDEKYPIRDIEKAMEWDWKYRNEIVLHFEVFFCFCIS